MPEMQGKFFRRTPPHGVRGHETLMKAEMAMYNSFCNAQNFKIRWSRNSVRTSNCKYFINVGLQFHMTAQEKQKGDQDIKKPRDIHKIGVITQPKCKSKKYSLVLCSSRHRSGGFNTTRRSSLLCRSHRLWSNLPWRLLNELFPHAASSNRFKQPANVIMKTVIPDR